MNITNTLRAILVGVFFVGCQNVEVTPQPPVITDQNMCPAACINLRSHKCDEGYPIDMHKSCLIQVECGSGQTCDNGKCMTSCEVFCKDTEDNGVWLDPICVSHITSCNQLSECPTVNK